MNRIKKRGIVIILVILTVIALFIPLFILIYNSPPTITEINLLPEKLYKDYNLKGNINIKDSDNKLLETHFIWYKNNEKIFEETKQKQESGKSSYSILNNEYFNKNDRISLEAYASDNQKKSKLKRIETSVKNSPPQQPILIKPKDYAVLENNNIEFEYKSIDVDGDKITYTLYINDSIEKTIADEKTTPHLKDGDYTWQIIATDGIEESSSGIYHLKIGKKPVKKIVKKGPNKSPILIKNIENQTWDVFGFNLNAFNLNDYFKDEDNDPLKFDAKRNYNITIIITDDGRVSFLQKSGWYGQEHVTFTATDTIKETKSNTVALTVGKIKKEDKSLCPGPCCNVNCGKLTKKCLDGTTRACDMRCINGKCIPCSPNCGVVYQAPPINLPSIYEDSMFDSLPCIDLNLTEKEKLVTVKDLSLLEKSIPTGYSIITAPFSVDCDGRADLTINVPSNYEDIKALRCEKDKCYSTILLKASELKCGGELIKRTLRQEIYFEPELLPIKISETDLNIKEKITLPDKKIKISFYGDKKNTKATLRMPSQPIKEAQNPSLKIVTTPVILKIDGTPSPNAIISLPYSISEKIAEESISFYVKTDEEWNHLGGAINKEDKTVEIDIKDIKQYADENNEITLTLMGIILDHNLTSSLTKEYEPIQESKDMIVLIHGLASSPATYQELLDDIMLTNQPYHVYALAHSSYKSVQETAEELKEYLELNSKQYENIYIVAHSLGGLIAQKALYDVYIKNKDDETRYSFINKVRKVILASSINEGSPIVQIYYELFKYLINKDTPFTLFELNSAIINDLNKGLITPKVPGINYYVIAGTKPYPFLKGLEKITSDLFNNQPNDGIITTKNAQHVGNTYLNKLCENYWEFNLTHTEIIDDERARKVILSIIAEDKFQNKELPSMGNNKYFELQISDCSKDDSFIVIGKKIEPQPLHETLCGSCGDGYCSAKESIFDCPKDCVKVIKNKSPVIIINLIITALLTISLVIFTKKVKKRKAETKQPIQYKAKEPSTDIILSLLEKKIQELRKHYPDEKIIKILESKGWKKDLINKAMLSKKKKKQFKYFGFLD